MISSFKFTKVLNLLFLILPCLSNGEQSSASENKTLSILSPLPSQWTKGTWMSDVIRDFRLETGIEVKNVDINSLIDTAKFSKKEYYEADFLGRKYVNGEIDWDIMYISHRHLWSMTQDTFFKLQKLSNPNSEKCRNPKLKDKPENKKSCSFPIPFRDIEQHAVQKLLFKNYYGDKEIVDLHLDAVKKTRNYEFFGQYGLDFESVPQGMFVNLDIAKKLGIEVPITGLDWKTFRLIIKKVHKFNQDKKLENKIKPLAMVSNREFFESLLTGYIENDKLNKDGSNIKSIIKEIFKSISDLKQFDPLLKKRLRL